MYISEVSGHHSATIAIEKAIKILEPDAEVMNINGFKYTNPISERVVNSLYMGVIKRTPQLWDYLYDNPEVAKKIASLKEMVHGFNSPKLKGLFDRFKPDAVACTQAFPCGMAADFKKTYGSDIPLVAVLTDYIPHSYWVYDTIDYYIAPAEEVKQQLVKKGVAAEKIKTLGIPFDPKFSQAVDKDALKARLGLSAMLPTLLIMGGGQGLGPIKKVVKSLEKVEKGFQEIIVAGSNKKIYNSLKRKVKKYKKKILLFGYMQNIHELMSIADIIITKPGGVTTAEALSKNLPMIIIQPLPGQEAHNTAYLMEKGAAIKIDNPEDISFILEGLLRDKNKLIRMRESTARFSKPNASLDIARLLLKV